MASSDVLQSSYYFSVKIAGDSGANDAAFQDVTGLSKEMGIEEVTSGGENRFKYRLPTTVTYKNLELKRGIVLKDSPLIEWVQNTLDAGLSEAIQTKNILVNLLDADGQTSLQWTFENAYPVKWSMSDLKSQENALLIETIEMAYQYFEVDDPRNDQSANVASLFD